MGDYQGEYIQQYLCNINLRKKIKELLKEKTEILQKLEQLEKDGNNQSFEERKKRLRSLASEIQRNFECPLSRCGKKYGSEGSLNQHIKLKHPELVNKS
ncbi:unnamed protein product [Paramecium primaurelia]|uniref:C2H2-type domain-containing protein n=1 Tax=Paramecium primaurelia TaxID=5886 RepID=A0A8S1QKU0_PARPR|nr:unnamed protein product [Paramecium primaurelia]